MYIFCAVPPDNYIEQRFLTFFLLGPLYTLKHLAEHQTKFNNDVIKYTIQQQFFHFHFFAVQYLALFGWAQS